MLQKLFSSTKSNGETCPREWLVYSPAEGKVYCFVRKLSTKWSENDSSLAAIIFHGLDDWAHCQLIQTHENSTIPQSGTALFRAISLHQSPSGKIHSSIRTKDLARVTHPFG